MHGGAKRRNIYWNTKIAVAFARDISTRTITFSRGRQLIKKQGREGVRRKILSIIISYVFYFHPDANTEVNTDRLDYQRI